MKNTNKYDDVPCLTCQYLKVNTLISPSKDFLADIDIILETLKDEKWKMMYCNTGKLICVI